MLIRPIETGAGFTSLPDDRDFLARHIAETRTAFEKPADEPSLATGPDLYFFVLEDDTRPTAPTSERIAGYCTIETREGLNAPFYNYRIGKIPQACKRLNLNRALDTLFCLQAILAMPKSVQFFFVPHGEQKTSVTGHSFHRPADYSWRIFGIASRIEFLPRCGAMWMRKVSVLSGKPSGNISFPLTFRKRTG